MQSEFCSWQNSIRGQEPPKMYIQCTSPGDGQTSCKVFLTSVERRRWSNEAKTLNPLKFVGVPQKWAAIKILFTHAMPASMDISYQSLCVYLSVTSQCSTETVKHRITQTMPHNSPGTPVFWCRKSWQTSNRVAYNGGAKCRWHKLNAGVVAANCKLSWVTSLSHWASTLFVCSTLPWCSVAVRDSWSL